MCIRKSLAPVKAERVKLPVFKKKSAGTRVPALQRKPLITLKCPILLTKKNYNLSPFLRKFAAFLSISRGKAVDGLWKSIVIERRTITVLRHSRPETLAAHFGCRRSPGCVLRSFGNRTRNDPLARRRNRRRGAAPP